MLSSCYQFFFRKIVLPSITIVLFLLIIENHTYANVKKYNNDYNWTWFFYEYEKNQYFENKSYRPFYIKHDKGSRSFSASLMPVFFWRYKSDKKDQWKGLFGFIDSTHYFHKDGNKDYDLVFFPLFFGHGIDEKDNYFMFWPIGGTLKQKFAQERISAYIFPGFLLFLFFPPAHVISYTTLIYISISMLPVYSTYEFKDYKGWGILWPLIHRGKSHNRDEIRIIPFYGHIKKEGWYDKYSIFMIFNYQRIFYKNDEQRVFFLFPLFGKKWSTSSTISATTILWPLFSWGYDKRKQNYEMNIPWPIIQIQDCEKPIIRKRIFFPIYGDYRYSNSETFFLTPLYFSLKKRSEVFESEYYINFFVFWFFKREYPQSDNIYYGNSWRYIKLWPLFNIEYNNKGDFSFNTLSLLPFRDPYGYELLYNPFWSIIEYRKFRNGEKRLGLFFRTYFQRWGNDGTHIKIPFIITYEKRENKLSELSFLLSMFAYYRNMKGQYIRLFWIPIMIKKDTEDIVSDKNARHYDGNNDNNSIYIMLANKPIPSIHVTHRFF